MIREINDNEIDKVMKIWEESTIKAHNFIEESYWKENYNKVKDIYIPMAETFVYDDGIDIRGFISVIDNNFIGALFVDTNFQNLGIGSKLIDFAVERYKLLNLAVYKENEGAVNFYISKNFKIIKEQTNEDSGFLEYIMSNCN